MIPAHGCTCVQVLTSQDEFAAVRDKLLELGLSVDHDNSGLVFAPLTILEVHLSALKLISTLILGL